MRDKSFRDIRIFIDSNIYIGFYQNSLNKDLNSIINIKNNILVTQHVADEVNRQKLHRAMKSLGQTYESLKNGKKEIGSNENIFAFRDTNTKASMPGKELQEKIKQIKKEMERLITDFKSFMKMEGERISQSQDLVSLTLAELFKEAIRPTADQLQRAMVRLQMGNPPGKQNSAIGDQLNWEQIIDFSKKSNSHIWIVSKDGDFATSVNNGDGIRMGNPFLIEEIRRGRLPEFRFYDLLSRAITDLEKELPLLEKVSDSFKNALANLEKIQTQKNDRIIGRNCPHSWILVHRGPASDTFECKNCGEIRTDYYD